MRQKIVIAMLIVLSVSLLLLPIPAIAQLGIDTGLQGDDYGTNDFPIGFTFNYWGTDYTTFGVTTNGWISLQNTAVGNPYTNMDFPMQGDLDGMIAAFFDDVMTYVSGQPEGKILYMTMGQEPNRQLVVQYNDQYFYGSDLPMGTFEIILYEGTNQIKFQYRYLRDEQAYGNSATIGLDNPETDEFVRYSFNTNSLTERQAIQLTPDGLGSYTINPNASYAWIDISGLTSLPPQDGGEYAGTDIIFTWEPVPGSNAYSIDIASSPDEANIIESHALENVTTFTYSDNLEEGNTYYARVAASLNYGGTYQNPSLFSDGITIDLTPPTVNKPIAVPGAEERIADFHLSGSDNHIVASYHIQIATDPSFSALLVDTDVINTRRYSHTGSLGQILYARAYAVDVAGNQSDYSEAAGPFEIPLLSPIAFSSDAYPVDQGDDSVEITVELLFPGDRTVNVNYATKDGTAIAGNDYTPASGLLTFAPGESTKSFAVTLLENTVDTLDQTFTVFLSNPQGAELLSPSECGIQIKRAVFNTPPEITRPTGEDTFTDPVITVSGTAAPGLTVEIFVNGVSQGTAMTYHSGHFILPGVRLSDGGNSVVAVSSNYYGVKSPTSEPLTVVLYPRPPAPSAPLGTAGDTVATLTWTSEGETDAHEGYAIYRNGHRLNHTLITETHYKDTRLTNGKMYHYTIVSVDAYGTEGYPSTPAPVTPQAGPEWEKP